MDAVGVAAEGAEEDVVACGVRDRGLLAPAAV
jgi:hypothetical protein